MTPTTPKTRVMEEGRVTSGQPRSSPCMLGRHLLAAVDTWGRGWGRGEEKDRRGKGKEKQRKRKVERRERENRRGRKIEDEENGGERRKK